MSTNVKSGLDIDLGNQCSEIACAWCSRTWNHRKGHLGEPVADVRASFSSIFKVGNLKFGITSDGIGTKIEIAERTGIYHTLGFDLVAMVVDDLVANGIEPICLTNILDVDCLDPKVMDALMNGLHAAAADARIFLAGGETAELGSRICGWGEGMHFNWGATAVGILQEGFEPIDGRDITVGDLVLSLREWGYRSNGFSLIRKILTESHGKEWHKQRYTDTQTWGEVLLTPSVIYAPVIVDMMAADIQPHGMAHITGGGIPDKLGRILKICGLGAQLSDLFSPPEVVSAIQKIGNVGDEVAYRMWNMGNGFLLVLRQEEAQRALTFFKKVGKDAKIVGEITPKPAIRIQSRGMEDREIQFLPQKTSKKRTKKNFGASI